MSLAQCVGMITGCPTVVLEGRLYGNGGQSGRLTLETDSKREDALLFCETLED